MGLRRSKSDDYIGPSTGVMKWVNKFFRFILFPFIHPLFFVIILAVLGGGVVAIHYLEGVAYKDIPSWLGAKNKAVFASISDKVDISFIKNMSDKITGAVDEKDVVLENIDENTEQEVVPVRQTVRAIDRKAFVQALDNPIDVKATVEGVNREVQPQSKEDMLFKFKRVDNLGLIYKDEPRSVKGTLKVVNVNEIIIGGERMFLYGIFSPTSTPRGKDGAEYLKKLVADKEVECRVVAFTQNAELTAVCAVDGIAINHKLVDRGFSKNVSLR